MRQLLNATVILAASTAVTAAVLAVILPVHPFAGGAERVAASTIRPAVFSDAAQSRAVLAAEPGACPFLAARAAAAACPYLAATASSSCPYLAGRAAGDGCPSLEGRRGKGADDGCPYLEGREGMTEAPGTCPRSGDREPSLPAGGPEKPRYPQLASVEEAAAGASELS